MIRLSGVCKRFGAATALHPLDLEFTPRRTTVLLGQSGCGKSTLLRLLVGLLRPDAGSIAFDGDAYAELDIVEIRRRLGYVIQEGGLFPHLTARENLALLPRRLGWDAARLNARVAELEDMVQLPAGALDRYPRALSGGQRQRVGLMRALMTDPKVLLLDEPLGALDPLIRADLQTDLKRIFDRLDKTVILVTHDLAEAAYFGHEVVLLREGRVVQRGAFRDLVHAPADPYVTRFIQAQRTHLHFSEAAS